jgi:hypothetical protein
MNWFALVEEVKLRFHISTEEELCQTYLGFVSYLSNSNLSVEDERQAKHSRQVFLELEKGKIVGGTDDFAVHTDSESDNPEEWAKVSHVLSVEGQSLIKKQRKILKRKVARRIAKCHFRLC